MKLLYYICCIVLIVACKGGEEQRMIRDIRQLEANKSLATSDTLINTYVQVADRYPKHDSAVKYLFRAARASIKSNKEMKGIKLFERVANDYKDTILGPEALIIAGMVYTKLPDPVNAKRVFEQFVRQYPTHPRNAEMKIMAEEAGMSDEEQMQRFLQRIEQTRVEDSLRHLNP
jgi:outer membrane protein assembly factor BamD (BamD/ComL family)